MNVPLQTQHVCSLHVEALKLEPLIHSSIPISAVALAALTAEELAHSHCHGSMFPSLTLAWNCMSKRKQALIVNHGFALSWQHGYEELFPLL